jgi:polysaccharide biosynthesis protein PelD
LEIVLVRRALNQFKSYGGRLFNLNSFGNQTAVQQAWSFFETFIGVIAAVALGAWLTPEDAFGIKSQFPWVWLVPLVFTLRYGVLVGIWGTISLAVLWFVYGRFFSVSASAEFPREYFLGGLALMMIAGQFADVYNDRISKLKSVNAYIDERLSSITRAHYLIKLSHERIEQELLVRPVTLRDLLTDLQGSSDESASLKDSQPLLQLLGQSCEAETAAIYAANARGVFDEEPLALLGDGARLNPNDPLVKLALEVRELAHVQSSDASLYESDYLVCAPIITSSKTLIGMLVVRRMPFFALNHENLQLISVLLGYYADGIVRRQAIHRMLVLIPQCPPDFALELTRLHRLKVNANVDSAMVAFVFDKTRASPDAPSPDSMYDQIYRLKRSLDLIWELEAPGRRALVFLLPLSGVAAIEGFLIRIEDTLKKQFDLNFSNARIEIHQAVISIAEPEWLLDDLLNRCRLSKPPTLAQPTLV